MEKELNDIRLGFLTLYILTYVQKMPAVGMYPFSALIAQDIESDKRLRAGKSLVFSRLKDLSENGFLKENWGKSSNPRIKKKVKYFSISAKGRSLIEKLELEEKRIQNILHALPA
jgi:DNA-binding PadR family transcriptional regulator